MNSLITRLKLNNLIKNSTQSPIFNFGGLLLLFFFFIFYSVNKFESQRAEDFYQFWAVGQSFKHFNSSNVYSKKAREQIGSYFRKYSTNLNSSNNFILSSHRHRSPEFAGTPFLYTIFYLLSIGDFDRDYLNFRIILLISYSLSVFYLFRIAGYNGIISFLGVAFFSIYFWPFHNDIRYGNITSIQLGIMALSLFLLKSTHSKPRLLLLGALMGFGVMFKPNLMMCAILLTGYWLINNKNHKLILFNLAFAGACLLSVIMSHLILGDTCKWTDWLKQFNSIALTAHYTKDSLLSILLGYPAGSNHHIAAIALSIIIFVIMAGKYYLNPFSMLEISKVTPNSNIHDEEIVVFSLGNILYILISPLVHGQYFLLCLPLFIFFLNINFLKSLITEPTYLKIFFNLTTIFSLVILLSHPVRAWHFQKSHSDQAWNYFSCTILFANFIIYFLNSKRLNKIQPTIS